MLDISFLSDVDFITEPLSNEWKGSLNHIGPVQMITPLVKSIGGKTTFGTVTLMSGILAWGAERLRPHTDVSYLDELAEAVFAWQHDWQYLKWTEEPKGASPDQPVAISAAMTLRSLYAHSVNTKTDWYSFYQPLMNASHMINVVHFILAEKEKKAFKKWRKAISDRLDVIAKIPDLKERKNTDFESKEAFYEYKAPMRGTPLPPIVLNPKFDITNINLAAESVKFLASLDPKKNRYLKTPEEMLAEGFTGAPYGI